MGKLVITQEMLDRLKYLLENTDMSVDAISTETGMARSTVNIHGKKLGFDMKERFNRIRAKKFGRDKDRLANPYSHIPDSLTGDGYSLEWLSKRW
jgi:hypothetical protein